MKALVIAPQPFFSSRGTPLSVYYRTLVETELGVEVDLLTYGEGQDVNIPGVRIIRIPRFAFLGNVKIGPSFLKLFLDLFMVIWTIGLISYNRYDFVHAHEEAVFFCRYLKLFFRFKLIYDMHSRLSQQLKNFQFTNSKLLINLFKMLEDSCLHAADAVITICPDLSRYVNEVIDNSKKHCLIENSIFDQVKTFQESSNLRLSSSGSNFQKKTLELPRSKRFVVYTGTLEPYQGIDMLIAAFKMVVAEIPDSCLLIVGGSKRQVEHYSAMAENYNLGDYILFTGHVSQSLAKHYSQLSSVLVSPRIKGTNTPLKIYEQLASGIPLVATNIYSHTQVLNEDVAFMVEPDSESMARGIITALKSGKNKHHIEKNARRLYQERYSRPIYVKKLQYVLELLS